jgi:opacity protein-like surface antigen
MKRILLTAALAFVSSISAAAAADVPLIVDDQGSPLALRGAWDGAFVGAFGGYSSGSLSAPVPIDLTGLLLGVNGGANFTLDNGIVVGVVGDLAWSNITTVPGVIAPPGAFDVNWTGSVRARVGYDAGAFMPYLTAGIAVAGATLTASTGTVVGSNTHLGWTAGGGLEFRANDDLSVDVGYRYTDYAAANYGTSATPWKFATQQISTGLNWHF